MVCSGLGRYGGYDPGSRLIHTRSACNIVAPAAIGDSLGEPQPADDRRDATAGRAPAMADLAAGRRQVYYPPADHLLRLGHRHPVLEPDHGRLRHLLLWSVGPVRRGWLDDRYPGPAFWLESAYKHLAGADRGCGRRADYRPANSPAARRLCGPADSRVSCAPPQLRRERPDDRQRRRLWFAGCPEAALR